MKKVACFFADGSEEIELLSVVDVLRRAGVQADLISISGEMPTAAHGVIIKADLTIDEAAMSSYDAIYIPGGGRGAENLADNEMVIAAIQDFNQRQKIVSAICAGPTVLERAGILKGHEGTSYPGFEGQLNFILYREDLVVVSENIVTSRGPATALLMGFELLRQLDLHNEADKIWDDMLMGKLKEQFQQK